MKGKAIYMFFSHAYLNEKPTKWNFAKILHQKDKVYSFKYEYYTCMLYSLSLNMHYYNPLK